MSKPLVSVCLITYNHENFIAQAIESVLMQKVNFPFEFIIADDCSTDRTREIIKEYAARNPYIKLILQEGNVGPAQNVIDLLTAPVGKYVAYLEGDDYWTDPLKLQRQADFLEANPDFTICFHQAKVISSDKSKQPYLSNPNQKETIFFEDLASGGNCIQTASCVFRNNLFPFSKFIFLQKKAQLGDWILHLLNAEHGKIKFLEDVMSVYRVHKNGAWSNRSMLSHSNAMIETAILCKEFFSDEKKKYFDHYLAKLYADVCFIHFENNSYLNYQRNFKKFLQLKNPLPFRTLFALKIRFLLSYIPGLAKVYKKFTAT